MGLFDGIKKVFGLGEPDPGDVTSVSGPARGQEPAEPQIAPWADDFLKECEKKLDEFNATADKDSPEYPGALADIVNEVREEFEKQEALIPYEVRKVMGAHLIGPEAYKKVFGAKDLGEIPPIPAHITQELLREECELTQDGRTQHTSTIAEIHRLVFIPSSIDGEPFTIMKLKGIAKSAGAALGRPRMFFNNSWYRDEPFANTAKDKGEWVLVPMTDLPNSRRKTYDEQNAELQKYPHYRGATALELVTTLIMNDLILQPRREDIGAYSRSWARCTDKPASGARVYAGPFGADGLHVNYDHDDDRGDHLGRAVVRK